VINCVCASDKLCTYSRITKKIFLEDCLSHTEWLPEGVGYIGKALPVVVSILMSTVGMDEFPIKSKYT